MRHLAPLLQSLHEIDHGKFNFPEEQLLLHNNQPYLQYLFNNSHLYVKYARDVRGHSS